MSTTFGIKLKTGKTEPIARRVGIGNGKVDVYFTNTLAHLLPDSLKVIAMDNSEQGIYTIGDIKQAIKDQSI